MTESLQLRVHDRGARPTLIHLPGLHGDWTLMGPFRKALQGRACLVELSYPRRPDWQLADYAGAVEAALLEQGVTEGWLLAESFSSQVGWQFVAGREGPAKRHGFQLHGLILVGGFIRHSWPWGVRLGRQASGAMPRWLLERLCRLYGRGHAAGDPAVAADMAEFVRRRLEPADREVMTSRYTLIAQADLRPVARRAALPVFHLTGAIDPLVPWPLVRAWLRRHCPGFRASRIVGHGGHNVLLRAPKESADQVLQWVAGSRSTAGEAALQSGRAS